MFNHLFESGGAHPRPAVGAWALSALANAVVAAGAVTATRAPEAVLPGAVDVREVVYLLPMPPRRVPFEAVGVYWPGGAGPGSVAARAGAGLFAAEPGGDAGPDAGRRGRRRRRGESADTVVLPADVDGGTVYIASELDKPVSFDPTSAAPAYPPELRAAGIEGSATLRFVVDTTGEADPTTVEVIAVTHPGFAAAVLETLPLMHFRPAELGDRRVRQLVEQQFKFRIQLAASAPPNDSVP